MSATRSAFLELAGAQLGVPYVFGGTGLAGSAHPGLDCSGLPYAVCGALGLVIPRTSQEQFAGLEAIPFAAREPGDLVFYDVPEDGPPQPQHEGIFWGAGQILQAPHTGDVVKISPLDLGYTIMGYRRIPFVPEPLEATDVTSWTVGGQNHVAGIIAGVAYHWWQSIGGNPAGEPTWHVEQLPLT